MTQVYCETLALLADLNHTGMVSCPWALKEHVPQVITRAVVTVRAQVARLSLERSGFGSTTGLTLLAGLLGWFKVQATYTTLAKIPIPARAEPVRT